MKPTNGCAQYECPNQCWEKEGSTILFWTFKQGKKTWTTF